MKPVYIDLHIHTSEDPNHPNQNYDVTTLLDKIYEVSNGSGYMISLTDHNMINLSAYKELLERANNVLLGAELHIRNYQEAPPYHCHIFFNVDINEQVIMEINQILDHLYPDKEISGTPSTLPTLEDISRNFDSYDFLLLPHGGQSHKTFDKSIPRDRSVRFDTTLERSIYYNQFDGFTARSTDGLEETQNYFRRLGIDGFVNLITCSDNYDPANYPNAKADGAGRFLPTWMYATPSFEGLRLSLSEISRFVYCDKAPSDWTEFIGQVRMENEKISIDVTMTPGLNVVIGGSSSGKTLLVDSIFRKINGSDFGTSNYVNFDVKEIAVYNPSNVVPHYINQNFIIDVLSDEEKSIDDIEIVQKVFPLDASINKRIRDGLAQLKEDLSSLTDTVKKIEDLENDIDRIPLFTRLFTSQKVKDNLFKGFLSKESQKSQYSLNKTKYDEYEKVLKEIKAFLSKNPFVQDADKEIDTVIDRLNIALDISMYEKDIQDLVVRYKSDYDEKLKSDNFEAQTKAQNRDKLFKLVAEYLSTMVVFNSILQRIAKYDIRCETSTVEVSGHNLSIENSFVLSKDKVLECFNKYLKQASRIETFSDITPQALFESNFKKNPKVADYSDFSNKVYRDFEQMNKKKYQILTKDKKRFDELSPGWKSAVLLDIILGYMNDIAPLIIDQPEDNLATNYINRELVESIKKIKAKKQVILVSHNATIPMLGDAQNVILCRNEQGRILIRSNPLEGQLNEKRMVDWIAEITDGGKPSIKKRVKKYNLKTFRGEYDEV